MAYAQIHPDIPPPCEQCRPALNENNWEAWEIYQFASMGPWGTSMSETLQLAKEMSSGDPVEICLKVAEIIIAMAKAKAE